MTQSKFVILLPRDERCSVVTAVVSAVFLRYCCLPGEFVSLPF